MRYAHRTSAACDTLLQECWSVVVVRLGDTSFVMDTGQR